MECAPPRCCLSATRAVWGARTWCVDGADARMGVGAAHKSRLQHAGKPQVIYEPARSGEQRPIFDPPDGFADRAALLHAVASGYSLSVRGGMLGAGEARSL